jgi:hypothetical protein
VINVSPVESETKWRWKKLMLRGDMKKGFVELVWTMEDKATSFAEGQASPGHRPELDLNTHSAEGFTVTSPRLCGKPLKEFSTATG